MTKEAFLALASQQWDKVSALQEEKSFYEYEKKFEEIWINYGREALEQTISAPKADRRKKKKLNSRFGTIAIANTHDWSAGLNGFQITPYLQELQAFGGQMDNYTAAVLQLEKHLRIPISRSQMERVTKYYGEQLTQEKVGLSSAIAIAEELKESVSEEGVTYCMIDGSMLPTREGLQHNDWKEVKLGRIFTSNDILELDANHNYIRRSVYSAHLGDYKHFLENFIPLTDVFEPLKERFVFIGDGAKWAWNWVTASYPKATQILDFYHAMEHLAKFSKTYFATKEAQENWLSARKLDLFNDRILAVIEGIKTMRKTNSKIEIERKSLLTYLNNNHSRMLYKTFRDRGLDIGSGAIESAHRTVLQKRLKQSGQRWGLDGAQKVINLRIVNMNQQWDKVIDLIKDKESKKMSKAA